MPDSIPLCDKSKRMLATLFAISPMLVDLCDETVELRKLLAKSGADSDLLKVAGLNGICVSACLMMLECMKEIPGMVETLSEAVNKAKVGYYAEVEMRKNLKRDERRN